MNHYLFSLSWFFAYFLLQSVPYFSSGSLLVCVRSMARKPPLASLKAEMEQAVVEVTGTELCRSTALVWGTVTTVHT